MNTDLISREDLKQNLFVLFGNQLPNGLLEYIDSIKAYNTSTNDKKTNPNDKKTNPNDKITSTNDNY